MIGGGGEDVRGRPNVGICGNWDVLLISDAAGINGSVLLVQCAGLTSRHIRRRQRVSQWVSGAGGTLSCPPVREKPPSPGPGRPCGFSPFFAHRTRPHIEAGEQGRTAEWVLAVS